MTVKEIAALAGVSRGTVDRVIHNRPGVSPENLERIQSIIREYDFHPNTLARALSRKQVPKCIGVVVNSEENPFFDEVLRGLEQCRTDMAAYGISLKLVTLKGYRAKEQKAALDRLIAQGVDGLIVTAVNHPEIRETLRRQKQNGLPVITLNTDLTDPAARTDYIGCDYYESGRLAGGALDLLASGRSLSVAVVQGSDEMYGHARRLEGFLSVAQELPGVRVTHKLCCEYSDDIAYAQTARLLQTDPPDLIYVVTSGTLGVLRAIEDSGKPVTAITNDLLPFTRQYLQKGIVRATIFQQPFEQGYNAVSRMIDHLYGQTDRDPACYQIRLEIITKFHSEGE